MHLHGARSFVPGSLVPACLGLALVGLAGCGDDPATGSLADADATASDAAMTDATSSDATSTDAATTDATDATGADTTTADTADSDVTACDPGADHTAEDLLALRRLGLRLAPVRLEGSLGAAAPVSGQTGELAASLHISKVWFGPSFLEGSDVTVHLDAAESALLDLPGEVILGFDGNPYPTWADDGSAAWWTVLTAMPASVRAGVADLLDLRRSQAPRVAVVEITAQDAYRTTLHVVETLVGDFPATTLALNWTTTAYAAAFPGVGAARYVAAFSDITYYPSDDTYLASVADFRPWSEAAVARATAPAPEPEAPAPAELLDFAADYQRGWSFHRAPHVIASAVSGLADECCTGAGGTYVAYDIAADLRGATPPARLMRGGHAYYSDEACGDGWLFGLDAYATSPPEPPSAFGCTGARPSLNTGLAVAKTRVAWPDSVEHRAAVASWLAADEPVYRLWPEGGAPTPTAPGPNAPWSTPLALDRAAAAGALVLFEVVDVRAAGDAHVVTLETTFTPSRYEHQTVYRADLAFTCGDARLLEKGSQWLAPMVLGDASAGDSPADGAFLVPGALLPRTGTVERILTTFGYTLRR